jgi:hypothetical protein
MSLAAFQRALCDLIASPALCLACRDNPDALVERYDLTPRERRRLIEVVWQPGMSTNCTIYRSNRITPIYTLLNLTCFILGDALVHEVDSFWQNGGYVDAQYGVEIERFGSFLKQRLQSGALQDRLLEEVLDFELAVYALQFCPRRRILRGLEGTHVSSKDSAVRLHPLVRIVRFHHDPATLLKLLADQAPLPYALPQGEFFAVLSIIDGPLEVKKVDAEPGTRLLELQNGGPRWYPPEEISLLVEAGVVLRGEPVYPPYPTTAPASKIADMLAARSASA